MKLVDATFRGPVTHRTDAMGSVCWTSGGADAHPWYAVLSEREQSCVHTAEAMPSLRSARARGIATFADVSQSMDRMPTSEGRGACHVTCCQPVTVYTEPVAFGGCSWLCNPIPFIPNDVNQCFYITHTPAHCHVTTDHLSLRQVFYLVFFQDPRFGR